MASTTLSGGCRNIFFIGAILFVGFLAYRTYQLAQRMEANPPVFAPGEAEFMAAEKSIVRNGEASGLGNTKDAREMAANFSKQMGVLREQLFTAGKEGDFSLTDGFF